MKYLLLLLLFIFASCSTSVGEFGWAVSEGERDRLDQKLFVITDYKMMRESLIFSPGDNIHVVYKFNSRPSAPVFFMALYKKSLSFVETDLRRVQYDAETMTLKAEFENLEVGEYIIKLATDDGEMFDSVMFGVLPQDGYLTDDSFDESEPDEIIRYSRN